MKKKAQIKYFSLTDEMPKKEKLEWFTENRLADIPFESIQPDKNNNWLNITGNDFDELIPLMDKDVKAGKCKEAVFELFSRGIATQRDEWVYDFSKEALTEKMNYFAGIYQKTLQNGKFKDRNSIKWDRELTKYLERGIGKSFEKEKIVSSVYRPFTKKYFYFDRHFNGMTYQWYSIHNNEKTNKTILISSSGSNRPFKTMATDTIAELHVAGANQSLPLYRYGKSGSRTDNITDWGLKQFTAHYPDDTITKEDIFHYVYAVLHNPAYRRKYEINLKREFPRIPFYDNFQTWAEWGQSLINPFNP